MTNNLPQTVTELYPSKWLRATDLTKPATAKIQSVEFETVYDPRSREHVLKLVVSFEKAQKRLIPNKTQCEALWAITNSERFSDWPGHTVTLAPGIAPNKKPTIVISRPTAGNGHTPAGDLDTPMTEAQAVSAGQGSLGIAADYADEQDAADYSYYNETN